MADKNTQHLDNKALAVGGEGTQRLEENIARIASRAVSGRHPEGQIEFEIAELLNAALVTARARVAELDEIAERHKRLCLAELGGPAVWPCGCHVRILDHGSELLSGDGHEPCDHHAPLLAARARVAALQQPQLKLMLDFLARQMRVRSWERVHVPRDDGRFDSFTLRDVDELAAALSLGLPREPQETQETEEHKDHDAGLLGSTDTGNSRGSSPRRKDG